MRTACGRRPWVGMFPICSPPIVTIGCWWSRSCPARSVTCPRRRSKRPAGCCTGCKEQNLRRPSGDSPISSSSAARRGLGRSPGLLSDAEVEFVRAAVAGLAEFDDPLGVPCHRDWQPRNWLTAADGSVAVIDFGNSRVGYWWQDFERLWWSEWRADPELARGFFAGYGTPLDETTRLQLRATATQWLLSTIVWADEVDDASFGDHARTQLAAAMAGVDDPI